MRVAVDVPVAIRIVAAEDRNVSNGNRIVLVMVGVMETKDRKS